MAEKFGDAEVQPLEDGFCRWVHFFGRSQEICHDKRTTKKRKRRRPGDFWEFRAYKVYKAARRPEDEN